MKKQNLSKIILSLALTLVLLAGGGNIANFGTKLTAEAATAGQYYVRVDVDVTNSLGDIFGSFDTCKIVLYGKANNGTSSSPSTMGTISDAKETFKDKGSYTIFEDTYGYFPTQFTHDYKFGGGLTWRKLVYTLKIYVGTSSTSCTEIFSQEYSASSSALNAASGTFTGSVDLSEYPYVNNPSITGSTSVTIPTDSSTTTSVYSAGSGIKDQYEVAWVNNPTWSESNNYTTLSPTSAASSTTATFKNTPTNNYTVTIAAQWTTANTSHNPVEKTKTVTVKVHNSLTIKPNGGTYDGSDSNTVKNQYIGSTISLSTPERTGYTFSGWTKSGSGTLSSDNKTYTMSTANDTITANWTANNYKLNFDANGGSASVASMDVTYDNAIGSLTDASRTGYDFTGWYEGASSGNEVTAETVYKTASDSTVYARWSINNTAANEDKAAVDFGVPASISVVNNDEIVLAEDASAFAVGIGGTQPAASDALASGFSGNYTGAHGVFSIDSGSVKYTPTSFMSSSDTAYVAVSVGGRYVYSKLTVVPATVVYYEDDAKDSSGNSLITYTDGVSADGLTGYWHIAGSSSASSFTQSLSEDVYGYDGIYTDASSKTFSMGSAHIVSVSQKNNPNSKYSGASGCSYPTARFTFAGTGFDIVSLISNTTGSVEVKVYKGADASGELVYDRIVDTYYGYAYDKTEKEWTVEKSASNALYQIPVITASGLDYGTYTVEIIPTYSTRLNHTQNDYYDFYLDAVRIYDPTGVAAGSTDDSEIRATYENANEMYVDNFDLRDELLKSDTAVEAADIGAVFITSDMNSVSLSEYKHSAPKNEVYLSNGESVAFKLTVNQVPAAVFVSLHAPEGSATSVRFAKASGDNPSYSDAVAISTASSLYYKIPLSSTDWTDNGNGTFTTVYPIIINNCGDALLSICNLKISYSQDNSASPASLSMTSESTQTALAAARTVSLLSEDDAGLFVPESVAAEEITEEIVKGDKIKITVKTTADVARLTINGIEAECVETADGEKTWVFEYEAQTAGKQTLVMTAYDEYGCASEETEITVDVETRIEYAFNQLIKFISAIVEFINKIFASI